MADDLDTMKFPQLMELAKLHNLPGRGTARIGQLRAGIRSARGQASDVLRTALAAPVPAAAPVRRTALTAAATLPRQAAALLVWSRVSAPGALVTVYRDSTGRHEIHAAADPRGTGRRYTVQSLGGSPAGLNHRRLRDAQAEAQWVAEDTDRAHNDARLMERARLAGDADWMSAAHGQVLLALAEDARREGAARRAGGPAGPRELSGWGKLAELHRAAR